MKYKYSPKQSFEFLASGSVIHGVSGNPNFPVRLSNEVFKRCQNFHKKKDGFTLYDPCCGGGYMLTTIALLNYSFIEKIFGSDVNEDFINIANKNLSLLSQIGLNTRASEIESY